MVVGRARRRAAFNAFRTAGRLRVTVATRPVHFYEQDLFHDLESVTWECREFRDLSPLAARVSRLGAAKVRR